MGRHPNKMRPKHFKSSFLVWKLFSQKPVIVKAFPCHYNGFCHNSRYLPHRNPLQDWIQPFLVRSSTPWRRWQLKVVPSLLPSISHPVRSFTCSTSLSSLFKGRLVCSMSQLAGHAMARKTVYRWGEWLSALQRWTLCQDAGISGRDK